MKNYRFLVFGGICSGKTHFTNQLQERLNIPVYHLDDLFWYGNWENIGKEKLLQECRQIAEQEPNWIIEGNYKVVREALWQDATHVFFCDASFPTIVLRTWKRSMSKDRHGVPQKVREACDSREHFWELIQHVWKYRRTKRKAELAFCEEIRAKGANVQIVRTDKDDLKNVLHGIKPLE